MLFAWLWAELWSEPFFLESEDSASDPGEQGLLCSSTKVASLWSDAVPAEEWRYIVYYKVCDNKNTIHGYAETPSFNCILILKNSNFKLINVVITYISIKIQTSFSGRVLGEGWGARCWTRGKMWWMNWWVKGWLLGMETSWRTFLIRRPPHQLLKVTVHTDVEKGIQ